MNDKIKVQKQNLIAKLKFISKIFEACIFLNPGCKKYNFLLIIKRKRDLKRINFDKKYFNEI